MKIRSEVTKGDTGEVVFYHDDCPMCSDDAIINSKNGICSNCGVEVPKSMMQDTTKQTLRDQLISKFQPNPDGMSAVVRVSGHREGTLGRSTEGTQSNPTEG